jgi:hypothetical protein
MGARMRHIRSVLTASPPNGSGAGTNRTPDGCAGNEGVMTGVPETDEHEELANYSPHQFGAFSITRTRPNRSVNISLESATTSAPVPHRQDGERDAIPTLRRTSWEAAPPPGRCHNRPSPLRRTGRYGR